MKYTTFKFEDLEAGMSVKYPARGEESRVGIVVDTQKNKDNVSILVRWEDGEGVSTACRPYEFEILAKEKEDD